MDGGRWTVDGGRWTVDGRRRMVDSGRSVDGGRWTVDGEQRTAAAAGRAFHCCGGPAGTGVRLFFPAHRRAPPSAPPLGKGGESAGRRHVLIAPPALYPPAGDESSAKAA